MAIYHFLTFCLAAAAAAIPTPSDPEASSGVIKMESLVPYEDYRVQIGKFGDEKDSSLEAQRKCDLTLCTGPNFTGECSLWCYYPNTLQLINSAKRMGTVSARFFESRQCWFYGGPVCDLNFVINGPKQAIYTPGGNLNDEVRGKAGCVLCNTMVSQ